MSEYLNDFDQKGVNYSAEVRKRINAFKEREQKIWNAFLSHSEAYKEVLGLTDNDVEVLERIVLEWKSEVLERKSWEPRDESFLKVEVEGEKFAFFARDVCSSPYEEGGQWIPSIMAVCLSNPELNESAGGGTSYINVVPDDWHQKIWRHLAQGQN